MTEGPENIQIIRLATAHRANFSGKENFGHECKTGDQTDSRNNSIFKTTEDENKLKGLGTDESQEEDRATWERAFKKLRPPPKIRKRKPGNPERALNRKCKEIADLIKPFCEESRQRENCKKTISESVRRVSSENFTSLEFEDDSEFVVQRESNKAPTSPFRLKF